MEGAQQLDISDDAWSASLVPHTSYTRLACPLLSSPSLALLPMVTPEDGLSSRRTVAAGRRNNEYDEDMCEFLRIRFTPEDVPDEEGFLMRHDVNRISFDLRHASLSVSETALDASDGVVCSVTRTVRVLQTLPCVAMQTLDVTRVVSDKALFIDHFVRAPMSYGNGAAAWTFDGSLYNTSAAQHFVLSAASSDCVSGGGMLAASYMGLGEVTCEGFNVIPGEGAGSEARVRLRVPPETESFTLHIMCCCSEGKKARESMLALLRAGTSASSLVSRHDMAWEALWQSRVDIVSKAAGMLQEETSEFMRDLFTLRMAMYQLHASGGGLMDLSGTSASGASCVHVAIASSLLLPTYSGQVVPLSRLHEDGVPELGLSGLYLDMVPWSDIGRWSDPATGAPRFLLPMSDGLRPFASCMHAVSLWDTYRLSGDAGWLARVAFPVLSNVADMVCSMAQVGEAQSTYPYFIRYHLPSGLLQGFGGELSGEDHVLSVASAVTALRAASQASLIVAPSDIRRYRWTDVCDGLFLPFLDGAPPQVLAIDNSSSDISDLRTLGDVLLPLCHPSLRVAVSSVGSQVDAVLSDTFDYWFPRLSWDNVGELPRLPPSEARSRRRRRACNLLWCLHARARIAQQRPSNIDGFVSALREFFSEFRDAWGCISIDEGFGADLDLSSSLLLVIVAGLLGASINGEVADNLYYSEGVGGGVSVSTSAVMPSTWQLVSLLGAGGRRLNKDSHVPNRVLLPSSALVSSGVAYESWTVESSTTMLTRP